MKAVGEGKDSAGSEWIIKVVDNPDCFGWCNSKVLQYALCLLFDLRFNPCVYNCYFHEVNVLHMQHSGNLIYMIERLDHQTGGDEAKRLSGYGAVAVRTDLLFRSFSTFL